jgi:excisionase family DNA binding protein
MHTTGSATTRLHTIPETAEQLRLSARMVERLIERGDLIPVRIGRSVRVPDAQLDAFIARKLQNHHEGAENAPAGKAGNTDAQRQG